MAGSGRPINPLTELKESAFGAIRKAIPSPEEHNGDGTIENEKRHVNDAVSLFEESRNRIGCAYRALPIPYEEEEEEEEETHELSSWVRLTESFVKKASPKRVMFLGVEKVR